MILIIETLFSVSISDLALPNSMTLRASVCLLGSPVVVFWGMRIYDVALVLKAWIWVAFDNLLQRISSSPSMSPGRMPGASRTILDPLPAHVCMSQMCSPWSYSRRHDLFQGHCFPVCSALRTGVWTETYRLCCLSADLICLLCALR